MSKYTPEACARAGIPYDPEWREIIPDKGYSKMQFWETAYQNVLLTEEPIHARKERGIYEHASARSLVAIPNPDGTVTHLTPEYWRHEWRSMPDYDGPPMKAPSGVDYHRWWRPDGSSRLSLVVRVHTCTVDEFRIQRSTEIARAFGEIEEHREPRYWGGALMATHVLRDWCPKLAGVGE